MFIDNVPAMFGVMISRMFQPQARPKYIHGKAIPDIVIDAAVVSPCIRSQMGKTVLVDMIERCDSRKRQILRIDGSVGPDICTWIRHWNVGDIVSDIWRNNVADPGYVQKFMRNHRRL